MFDKGTVGNTSGGVIHCIWLDDGNLYYYYIIIYYYIL